MDQAKRKSSASVVIAECMRRADAGETVEPQQVLAEHPEIADELRKHFAAERMLGNLLDGSVAKSSKKQSPRASRDTASPGKADSVPASGRSFEELPVEFGRYRLQKVLGQGAMGAVYLAHDTKLAREVALKTPKLDVFEGDEMVERFEREARSAATLHHRNICPVFDVGEIDGVRFLTMAYIDGKPLSSYVSEEKPMSRRQAAVVVRKLALALQEAHEHGVVHRDLKPANVMIDKSREPVVMDFGLARQLESADRSRLTGVGVLMGSPAYMSPEQVGTDPNIGPPSDIYSLGVILFELLTGRLPFEGSVVAIIGQIVSTDSPDVRTLRPVVDEGLAAICAKMMAKSTADRYGSMKDVADALSDYLRDFRKKAAARTDERSGMQSVVSSDLIFDESAVSTPSSRAARPKTMAVRKKSNGDTKDLAKWIGGGLLGLVLLAGVVIKFRDGTTVEIPDGKTATIETNKDGSLKSLTFTTADTRPAGAWAESETNPADDGFVPLFNGEDLAGWRVEGGQGWSVSNGEILGRAEQSRLVTLDEDYSDCEIRVECRLGPGVNSGIYARNRYGEGHRSGLEAQLSNQPNQKTLTGGIFGHTVVKEQLIPDDQWFELRFLLSGRQLKVFVDGKMTSETIVPAGGPMKGAISLQSMNGGPVRFRKVEVRRLQVNPDATTLALQPDTPEMLPTGKWVSLLETEEQLQDWQMLNGAPTIVNGTVSLRAEERPGQRLYGKRLTRPISTNAKRFVFHVRHKKANGFAMGEGLIFGSAGIGVTNFINVFELWAGRSALRLVAKYKSREGTGSYADCDYVVIDDEYHAFLNGKKMYSHRVPQQAFTAVKLDVRKATAQWRDVAIMKLSDAQVEAFQRGELPKYSADQVVQAPSSDSFVNADGTGHGRTISPGMAILTGGDASQLAVSPDGQNVAVTGSDTPGRFTIWNIDTGDQVAQFDDPSRPGHATGGLSYSPDGASLLYQTGNEVRVVSAADGTQQATSEFPEPPTLTVFPKRSWAMALYHQREIHRKERADVPQRLRIWNWKTGQILFDEPSPQAAARFPAISPDERFVTLATQHHHIRFTLDVDGEDKVALTTPTQFESTSRVRGPLVFSPDGKYAATSVKSKQSVAVILDVQTGRIITQLDPATAASHNDGNEYGCNLGFSPDGTQIVVADHTGRSALWDVVTGSLLCELEQFQKQGNHSSPGVVVSRDGRAVLGGGAADRRFSVQRLDTTVPIVEATFAAPGVDGAAVTPADNWTDLFNGRDLTGWHEVFSKDVWSAANGELFSRSRRRKESLGWLATDQLFLNFELELEYFMERDGNSGIFLRCLGEDTASGANHLEIQLLDDGGHKYRNLDDEQRTGAIHGVVAPDPGANVPVHEWNRMKIKAVDSKIAVFVNDTQVIDADLDDYESKIRGRFQYKQAGRIGLQWYGTPVWFRNIRIRELNADG
ncbi:family 16 glycoside hydrolase [Fuerstiella marisgermanici]|uniref:Serine/threonine-protein kinase PrkC n=1 Tax=Fuerstiella marisgermanici TaxID=1891926 RepID=A0A1P8WP57_9PLAN|nr:family 16 glycoside hydrolase [Fuerstiella marisgermanici]APZ95828.1 Serine/threonine-protein kinase PrkC [Fuerstiella marisgermanici]